MRHNSDDGFESPPLGGVALSTRARGHDDLIVECGELFSEC